jgi:hypothetical protein
MENNLLLQAGGFVGAFALLLLVIAFFWVLFWKLVVAKVPLLHECFKDSQMQAQSSVKFA